MRHLGLCAVLLGACIPEEPDWLITEARFRGVQLEVVEPGGYSTQLHVPEGRRRATALPLDTIELEWKVALPPGAELQPPIWVACNLSCVETHSGHYQPTLTEALPECPRPLPLGRTEPCLLGEGHRLRVGLAGAFTVNQDYPVIPLLVVGSRRPDVAPATCLERLSTRPLPPVARPAVGRPAVRPRQRRDPARDPRAGARHPPGARRLRGHAPARRRDHRPRRRPWRRGPGPPRRAGHRHPALRRGLGAGVLVAGA